MASERRRRRKKNHEESLPCSKDVDAETNGVIISESEISKAQVVIQTLQAKYKHKLKCKETNAQPTVQIVNTDLPSPSKIPKMERQSCVDKLPSLHGSDMVQPQGRHGDEQTHLEDVVDKEVVRRVNPTRARRKLLNENSKTKSKDSKARSNDSRTTLKDKSNIVVKESTPVPSETVVAKDKEHVYEFSLPLEDSYCDTTQSVSDSFDYSESVPKPEAVKKPAYMKLLEFKTPVLEAKKKHRKRVARTKVPSKMDEEDWAEKMNKEFAEVDKFNLIVQ